MHVCDTLSSYTSNQYMPPRSWRLSDGFCRSLDQQVFVKYESMSSLQSDFHGSGAFLTYEYALLCVKVLMMVIRGVYQDACTNFAAEKIWCNRGNRTNIHH